MFENNRGRTVPMQISYGIMPRWKNLNMAKKERESRKERKGEKEKKEGQWAVVGWEREEKGGEIKSRWAHCEEVNSDYSMK